MMMSARIILMASACMGTLAIAAPAIANSDDAAIPRSSASSANESAPISDSLALMDQREIIVTGESDGYIALESVTGTKTRTVLLDVPQSISVMTREQIDDQALQDIGDILRYVPGVSVGQGEGNRDQITLRGQNTTADFYIDGIRDDVQYFRPLYNLDRVEVIKGSNALVFGRGGGGGVINRVTKSPVAGETILGANASVDSFGAFYFSGDVNVPIGDAAAARVNGLYEEYDNHRNFYGGRRYAVNPTIGANLGESSKLLLSYEFIDDQRTVDRGVPAAGAGTLGNPVGPLTGVRDTFFGSPTANTTTLEGHILRGRFEHDFTENLSFNATIQYADYDKLYQNIYPVGFNTTANTVTLDGYRDTTDRENFIAQGNLLWDVQTGFLGHSILMGYEIGDQKSANARQNVLFATSNSNRVTIGFSDPLNIPAFTFPAFNRNTQSRVDTLSFYAQDQISLGEHFDIVAGIRYDRFEIDVNDIQAGLTFNRTDNKWSPRFGLIFKPMESVSIYASYAKTFLPRSGDQFLTLTPTSVTLAPEGFENYEIGAKWDIRPDLRLTAAIFRLDRENGTALDPNNVNNSILTGSRTEGFEIELTGKLLPNWNISAGYSYLDGVERGRISGGVLQNRVLSQVPENMFSLWNRFDVTERLGVGAGVTHQSSQFASISNSVRLPSYTRFDAAVYFKLTDKIEAQINVENLFDEDYFSAAHNDNNISTGEPINARFTIKAKF